MAVRIGSITLDPPPSAKDPSNKQVTILLPGPSHIYATTLIAAVTTFAPPNWGYLVGAYVHSTNGVPINQNTPTWEQDGVTSVTFNLLGVGVVSARCVCIVNF